MAYQNKHGRALAGKGIGKRGPIDVGFLKSNLIGSHFGYLTPVKWLGRGYWECECDACDHLCVKKGSDLIRGKLVSCGCVRRDKLAKARAERVQKQTFRWLTAADAVN